MAKNLLFSSVKECKTVITLANLLYVIVDFFCLHLLNLSFIKTTVFWIKQNIVMDWEIKYSLCQSTFDIVFLLQ